MAPTFHHLALRFAIALLAFFAAAATRANQSPVAADGFVVVDSLDALRTYTAQNNVKVRLKPGVYTLDRATSRRFIELTGNDTHWDLRGVTLRIDTQLFREFGAGGGFYCAIALTGDRIVFEGLTTENIGDVAGIQGRNKIFSITGSDVTLRNIEITTSGSSPWGYGSLFGIVGGDVRKMNGIRVAWPARNVKLIGCKVHMRAFGHGIFLQGARDTLIQDCHVDGLLRPTGDILAETAGFAFERDFTTSGRGYVEGVTVGEDGKILPGETIALSEDGIRLYERAAADQPTGTTTIVRCTVTRMRRGICTGLSASADKIIDCEVRECIAAGFNIGSNDVVENSRADAKYAEALSLPYFHSRNALVDLEILDSRGGFANELLATINGTGHRVTLRTRDPNFVPQTHVIAVGTHCGYAFYQRSRPIVSRDHEIVNETPARVE